jgi:hypothetical protein
VEGRTCFKEVDDMILALCSLLLLHTAAAVAAFYSFWNIRRRSTATWQWHVAQIAGYVLYLLAGILGGYWGAKMATWHSFGLVAGFALLSPLLYVVVLHTLLRRNPTRTTPKAH